MTHNPEHSEKSSFDKIGPARLEQIIRTLYDRSFEDPIIFHLFMGKDKEHLIQKQIEFTRMMLGGPGNYTGKPLRQAHDNMNIRRAHFLRRKQIFKEAMIEAQLEPHIIEEWLGMEDKLIGHIVRGATLKECTDN